MCLAIQLAGENFPGEPEFYRLLGTLSQRIGWQVQ